MSKLSVKNYHVKSSLHSYLQFLFSLEQLEYKTDGANVSESYVMLVVFSCVMEICQAIDVLILDRASKQKKSEMNGEVEDVKHQDKTGLGSEAWKHNQPLDVEEEGE